MLKKADNLIDSQGWTSRVEPNVVRSTIWYIYHIKL